MSNATLRILTALVGAPLLLGLTYLGGWYFGGLMAVLTLLAQYEVYALMARGGIEAHRGPGLLVGALLAVTPMVSVAILPAFLVLVLLVAGLPFSTSERPFLQLGGTLLGVFYPAALLPGMTALRLGHGPLVQDLEAFYLTLTVFLLIWSTDTFAYYTGKAMGHHPLAPRVSPKKTWEGAVGGALGALVAASALKLTVLGFLPWVHVLAVAALCGVVSQLGDLAESKLKRSVDAKDSGTLLPGHGGVLDRFDALILAAPLVYLYLVYVARVLMPGLP